MKKSIIVSMLLMLVASISVMAQGGFQRRTPEERAQQVHAKLDSAFKLDAAVMAKVDSVFLAAYKEQDKVREELMSGGGQPDFQAMQEKMKPVNDARDAKLKPLLGDDKFKVWKEQIEPTLRRGGGGGRGGGNN